MEGTLDLDAVEAQVASVMGVLNRATAELVSVLAEVDATDAWEQYAGIRSLEHWVRWQCGVSAGRASALVAMVRRRHELPSCGALFDAGLLTEDAMATIARRVPGSHDQQVADLAPALLHAQLARLAGTLPPLPQDPDDTAPHDDDADADGEELVRRDVSFATRGGRWRATLDLPADEGALVEKAWEAIRDQLFRERNPDHDPNAPAVGGGVSWADAVVQGGELALRALQPDWSRPVTERFQVLVHLDAATREAQLHLGEVLPGALRRLLTCDCTMQVVTSRDGVPTEMSSPRRVVDRKLRRLVEHRDGGCVVPGCGQRRWLHIHHIRHWEDGGRTTPSNLCALCPFHHRLHHAVLLDIAGDPTRAGGLSFAFADGSPFAARPPSPPARLPDPPPRPFEHPTGEPLEHRWVWWPDCN